MQGVDPGLYSDTLVAMRDVRTLSPLLGVAIACLVLAACSEDSSKALDEGSGGVGSDRPRVDSSGSDDSEALGGNSNQRTSKGTHAGGSSNQGSRDATSGVGGQGGSRAEGGSVGALSDVARGGNGGAAMGGQSSTGVGGATTSSSRGNCKRGVAYGEHSERDLAALSKGVSFWYNWAYLPDKGITQEIARKYDVSYVPMVWGKAFKAEEVTASVTSQMPYLLGFNEPNFFDQANLSAKDAASLWPQVEAIADAHHLKLVSPAVNFCGGGCHDTDPVKYLKDFFAACENCRVDAIAIHIYVGCNPNGTNHAEWLISHLKTYEREFSQPIWVTEFACDDAQDESQQIDFLKDAVKHMEEDPRVERYAWFSGRTDRVKNADLLGTDGTLTELGKAYVSADATAGCVRP